MQYVSSGVNLYILERKKHRVCVQKFSVDGVNNQTGLETLQCMCDHFSVSLD